MILSYLKFYSLLLVCIVFTPFLKAQSDAAVSHGTIKIAKPKTDTVYIKAEIKFNQFQKGHKKNSQNLANGTNKISPPKPLFHYLSEEEFDYSNYFRKRIEIKRADLDGKMADTIQIQVKILDNGKSYFRDLTPVIMLNGIAAYYDAKMNAYKRDDIHWKCIKVTKDITEWQPAIVMKEEKGKFKRTTVIKLKEEKITSIGVLTIIFSSIPFNQ